MNNKLRNEFVVMQDYGYGLHYEAFRGTLLECAMFVYDVAPVRASVYYNRSDKRIFFMFDSYVNPYDEDMRNGDGRCIEYSIWPA